MLCHVFWSQVEYKIVCFIFLFLSLFLPKSLGGRGSSVIRDQAIFQKGRGQRKSQTIRKVHAPSQVEGAPHPAPLIVPAGRLAYSLLSSSTLLPAGRPAYSLL